MDYVSASHGGVHHEATHTVTWSIADVPAGNTASVTVLVRVNSLATVTIGNYATIQVSSYDPQFTNYVENPVHGSQCPKLIKATK